MVSGYLILRRTFAPCRILRVPLSPTKTGQPSREASMLKILGEIGTTTAVECFIFDEARRTQEPVRLAAPVRQILQSRVSHKRSDWHGHT